MTRADRELPAATVHFESDFGARLAALELRLAAARQSREGQGQAHLFGAGADLVGYRPYRPGEDLRQLDWNLLARLDRPFVRVTRREAGESWVVAIDASASMGVGPPGKLQRAAECAAALWAHGGRIGADVRVLVSAGERDRPQVFEGRAREGTAALLTFLEKQHAGGRAGLATLLERPQWFRAAARVYCISDLCDTPPELVLRLRRGSRELSLLQLGAPQEFDVEPGPVEWWDPEQGATLRMDVSMEDCSRYHAELEARLELWRELTAKHRIGFACRSTREDFELLVGGLLGR